MVARLLNMTGFETIDSVLTGEIALSILLLLIFGKILATTLTLGSGSSGGVFAPALFVGAVLGGAYGQIVQHIFPGLPISSGAYAMVGMAAVFAGAARAPNDFTQMYWPVRSVAAAAERNGLSVAGLAACPHRRVPVGRARRKRI